MLILYEQKALEIFITDFILVVVVVVFELLTQISVNFIFIQSSSFKYKKIDTIFKLLVNQIRNDI